MIPSDELALMVQEIEMGIPFGDHRSRVPIDDEHREMWARVEADIREMREAGVGVDVPHEIPDLT